MDLRIADGETVVDFYFDDNGNPSFLHDDDLIDLFEEGEVSIERASHVEPTSDGRWQADMSPVGGPLLPVTDTRQESLDAEVAWLKRHHFGE